MKKNIILSLLIIVAILFGLFLISKKMGPAEKTVRDSALFHKELPNRLKNKFVSTAFQDQEYIQAVMEIARISGQHNLNKKLLRLRSRGVSRDEFLKNLPPELKAAYGNLDKRVDRLEKEKRITKNEKLKLLRPEELPLPAWIKKRPFQIKPEVKAFVEEKKTWRSISNSDVEELINLCEKGRRCIDNSLKIWTDAGQKITTEQYQIIERAFAQ